MNYSLSTHEQTLKLSQKSKKKALMNRKIKGRKKKSQNLTHSFFLLKINLPRYRVWPWGQFGANSRHINVPYQRSIHCLVHSNSFLLMTVWQICCSTDCEVHCRSQQSRHRDLLCVPGTEAPFLSLTHTAPPFIFNEEFRWRDEGGHCICSYWPTPSRQEDFLVLITLDFPPFSNQITNNNSEILCFQTKKSSLLDLCVFTFLLILHQISKFNTKAHIKKPSASWTIFACMDVFALCSLSHWFFSSSLTDVTLRHRCIFQHTAAEEHWFIYRIV